jgi:hypothetical protein
MILSPTWVAGKPFDPRNKDRLNKPTLI